MVAFRFIISFIIILDVVYSSLLWTQQLEPRVWAILDWPGLELAQFQPLIWKIRWWRGEGGERGKREGGREGKGEGRGERGLKSPHLFLSSSTSWKGRPYFKIGATPAACWGVVEEMRDFDPSPPPFPSLLSPSPSPLPCPLWLWLCQYGVGWYGTRTYCTILLGNQYGS